ncbi:MAG: hypothetical protein N0E42_04335 [Candidatus Thiodiazotropha endolucinida]|nr:hypothetical protein [Candidatus Thiodiazotropha taylori]MCW4223705.1 hypothetical protein [Candidatus Thiodiazotropha endolucinida]MCG7885282.1 hypothetical protein [Candidatus Thiodiazotropha taylori]MCG8035382.1 hypothetical protein [Candidatus Thiodiazotropha taylori]MCG8116167.1 hypothetical protein [Candidatus Thiodiazotropha taylori]
MNEENVFVMFTGEESARFTRLAVLAGDAGISLFADVVGREPLTSRLVRIRGTVTNARLDGYMRYIVVEDDGAINVKYWVGGSNILGA